MRCDLSHARARQYFWLLVCGIATAALLMIIASEAA